MYTPSVVVITNSVRSEVVVYRKQWQTDTRAACFMRLTIVFCHGQHQKMRALWRPRGLVNIGAFRDVHGVRARLPPIPSIYIRYRKQRQPGGLGIGGKVVGVRVCRFRENYHFDVCGCRVLYVQSTTL